MTTFVMGLSSLASTCALLNCLKVLSILSSKESKFLFSSSFLDSIRYEQLIFLSRSTPSALQLSCTSWYIFSTSAFGNEWNTLHNPSRSIPHRTMPSTALISCSFTYVPLPYFGLYLIPVLILPDP